MAIVLTCRNGSLAGKTLEFSEPVITLGRKASSQVRFNTEHEPRVSNNHCEVFQNDGLWYVRDKESANGTFLDGQRLKTPARLHNGSVIKLSDTGPELVVSLPDESEMTMMDARVDMGAAANATVVMGNGDMGQAAGNRPTEPPPMPKDGIGMNTLQLKLDQAAFQVRQEYGSRMKSVYIAVAVVLVLAVGATVYVKISGEQKINEMQVTSEQKLKEIQAQSIAELNKSKQDAERRLNEIQNNAEANAQTKVEQMKQLLEEKTRSMEKFANEAKKAGGESQAMNQEMVRNRAALQQLQSHIDDLTAFVSFKEKYSKCVYSLALRFTEGGKVNYKFVGSAFSLSSNPGVLGTAARLVASIADLLDDKSCQLIARCNGDGLYSYNVAKTIMHPDFKPGASAGKDVALLELDLHSLKPDGSLGDVLPLPESLKPAADDELDMVVSGMNVAVFGFSESDAAKLEGATAPTGVATLLTNIVDGTYSYTSEPATGRDFGLLKHNCAVTSGFAGAPVVNTKYHVIGVQSIVPNKQNAGKNSAFAVSIKALQELLKSKYP